MRVFEDVRQWIPPQVLERHEQFLRQRSAAQRVEGELSSDEKDALNDYLALAKEGHHFVTVYVPDEADVERVESILESNGAKATHYYAEWKLTDLSINETNS
jgi:superfamily II DNA helicase RecQ